MAKLYLQLASGEVFVGESVGAVREVVGEVVFTTGVIGYLETITDPCNYGQIVVSTYPLAGNYGIAPDDAKSGVPQVGALVVREVCELPANYRSEGTLGEYLKKNKVVCLTGIDTRALTAILRERGTVTGRITKAEPAGASDAALQGYALTGAVAAVASRAVGIHPAHGGPAKARVAVIDCGARLDVVNALTQRGCMVTVYPPTTTAAILRAAKPDAIVVTPGPGDPRENSGLIGELAQMLGEIPMLGLGLGHQLIALAAGGEVVKLHCGHRGSNHPVKALRDGRVYISAQNHGYAVDTGKLPGGAVLTHVSVNDGTCEGIAYPAARAVGYQHDATGSDAALGWAILDEFLTMAKEAE